MKTLQFVGYLHIFRDLMTYLDPLYWIFQKQELEVGAAVNEIETMLLSLKELCASEGHKFFESLLKLNENPQICTFQKIELNNRYKISLESMEKKVKVYKKNFILS